MVLMTRWLNNLNIPIIQIWRCIREDTPLFFNVIFYVFDKIFFILDNYS